MLRVKDLPGRLTVAEMRRWFEQSITSTPAFKDSTPLGVMEINGEFSHYMTPDTDTMWLGFALGMRCAERIAAATMPHREADVGPLLYAACESLKEGWRICVDVECGYGAVFLLDPEDKSTDMRDGMDDSSLADQLREAMKIAASQAAEERKS